MKPDETPADDMTIRLTKDEALVLFDWVHRAEAEDPARIAVEHPAERRALWNLSALLESQLAEPFSSEWRDIVESARERLSDPPR
jgi:hypothetical protein